MNRALTRWMVMACLLCSTPAWAQSAEAGPNSEAKAEASAHFRRGVELFQEEAYRASLVEFQRAFEIAPDYRLLYNIGQAKLQVQDYLGAAQSYERYLTDGGSAISTERRSQVEQQLAAVRERVGSISIAVNRDGAEIFIDDRSVGTSPLAASVLVNVGSHRVSARTPDGANSAQVIDVAGGDIAEVKLELSELARAIATQKTDRPWTKWRKTGVASWIGAAALLGTGMITGIMAQSGKNDLDKLLGTPDVSHASVQSKRDSTRRLAISTDVMIGAGAASAVLGTLLWIYGATPSNEVNTATDEPYTKLRLDVGFASLGVHAQF